MLTIKPAATEAISSIVLIDKKKPPPETRFKKEVTATVPIVCIHSIYIKYIYV